MDEEEKEIRKKDKVSFTKKKLEPMYR